ncbi:hypothetical protein EON65_19010 [archaeon]|nr:MAG: hypothetical protein EON65_19010 [archaeon]
MAVWGSNSSESFSSSVESGPAHESHSSHSHHSSHHHDHRDDEGNLIFALEVPSRASDNTTRCGMPNLHPDIQQAAEARLRPYLQSNLRGPEAEVMKTLATINIPVFFHVLLSATGVGAVPDQQITNQITVLNTAFAGSGFSFVLAGITYNSHDAKILIFVPFYAILRY